MHNTAGHCPLQSLSTLLPLYPNNYLYLLCNLPNLPYNPTAKYTPSLQAKYYNRSQHIFGFIIFLVLLNIKPDFSQIILLPKLFIGQCIVVSYHFIHKTDGTLQVLFASNSGYSVFHILLPLLPWLPLQLHTIPA